MECLEEIRIVANDTDNNYTLLEVTTDKRKVYCKLPFKKVLIPHGNKKLYRCEYTKNVKDMCALNGICYRYYFNMEQKWF